MKRTKISEQARRNIMLYQSQTSHSPAVQNTQAWLMPGGRLHVCSHSARENSPSNSPRTVQIQSCRNLLSLVQVNAWRKLSATHLQQLSALSEELELLLHLHQQYFAPARRWQLNYSEVLRQQPDPDAPEKEPAQEEQLPVLNQMAELLKSTLKGLGQGVRLEGYLAQLNELRSELFTEALLTQSAN
jgi:hypothetical protein